MLSRRDKIVLICIAAGVLAIAALFAAASIPDIVQRSSLLHGGKAGMPVDWELNFQWPGSVGQRELYGFHNLLLVVDLGICSLIAILLIFVIWRFRASRNPVPSQTTHNTRLEITWTVIPILILVFIAFPSFKLLARFNPDDAPQAGLTVKVTGHQWYWEYQYPGHDDIDIISTLVPDNKLTPEQKDKRLLVADNDLVMPVDTLIKLQITGADVIHSFLVPSLGIQKYAVPGRTNEIWTSIQREGVYYGQCNQICGMNHAFMPIAIHAVSKARFADWIKEQGTKK
jgi:cytochrome c oxidase subunit 2